MAKVKHLFESSDLSKHQAFIECYKNDKDEIYISIESGEDFHDQQFVALDLETAIEFRDWLTKQIKS